MKNYYKILLLMANISIFAQSNIYSENFGNPTATTPITTYTGYQNTSPIVYSGTADLRTSTPSSGYTGSSANGCVFIGATTATPEKSLTIEGINTSNYNNITLSFGHQKGTNASSNELTVEVSNDGTTWTPLSYTRPTGASTSTWLLITPTGNIPSTPNLRIKFNNPVNSNVGFRIDDVKLVGYTTALSTLENSKKRTMQVFPTMVTDGMLHIKSDKTTEREIKIYDSVGKMVMNKKMNNTINVSSLPKGVYHLEINENDQVEIHKFIIQ
ncbi:T9SS type A sorting domain-containing protein [Chryseobacterium sp.]|uniref:T9SS type A sorting domain-containing protein n=1 Tax=Chryseobacterium sp. TaxID=1871047 RepID=UPI00388EE8A5